MPIAETLRRRGIPILIVSGYGQAAVRSDGYSVLSKPFSPDEIVSLVQRTLLNRYAQVGRS